MSAVIGAGGHMLRAIMSETDAAFEIPPRDGNGTFSVYGTVGGQRRSYPVT